MNAITAARATLAALSLATATPADLFRANQAARTLDVFRASRRRAGRRAARTRAANARRDDYRARGMKAAATRAAGGEPLTPGRKAALTRAIRAAGLRNV